ncbi:unnamed protein product [Urochloa decumbens]|uniref:MATH domain-containing protein n=1 Tax=Urochloa decumbens TaxID=240449 RepID=A0ABC8YWJ7_9POAL
MVIEIPKNAMEKPTTAISSSSLTVAATGIRRFTVDGYSVTKELAVVGDYYQSEQFTVSGHDWAIRYYPTTTTIGSWCEFYLVMLSRPPASGGAVGVTFACTPLDRRGEPSAGEERRLSQVFADGGGQETVWPISFRKEVMQSDEYVNGDCFAVQCTVSVLKKALC